VKVKRKEVGPERRIVTGMIVQPAVLGRIVGKWEKGGLFRSEWANIIGQWCVDHFLKYKKAPGKDITAWFEAWAEDMDKDSVSLVDRFLTSLSGEYARLKKDINPELLIDQAGNYFNLVNAERSVEKMQGFIENGEVEKAITVREKMRRIELGATGWVDVLRDTSAVEQAFQDKQDVLIKYRGALGQFMGSALERDGFIAFMAPEKRGKTFWLLDIAWRGMEQQRKVAFFSVGDLSQSQMMRRFLVRAAKRPMRPSRRRTENQQSGARYEAMIPVRFERGDDGVEIDHEIKTWNGPLTLAQAQAACAKVIQRVKSKDSLLRLSTHPNSSININGVVDYLNRWDRDGWSPDIVVIDYADILAPVNGAAETRDQINLTWKLLRRLSQERHCLVVTATQSDSASYNTDLIRMDNFSEDKRKFGHATGFIGINQTATEKTLGQYRLNWPVLREEESYVDEVVHCAGSLAIANPSMMSCW
jgi:hypothetical protein